MMGDTLRDFLHTQIDDFPRKGLNFGRGLRMKQRDDRAEHERFLLEEIAKQFGGSSLIG